MSDDLINQRVIYPDPQTGRVGILVPSEECPSIEALIADVPYINTPGDIPHQVVHVDNIPADRAYRNAWTYEED